MSLTPEVIYIMVTMAVAVLGLFRFQNERLRTVVGLAISFAELQGYSISNPQFAATVVKFVKQSWPSADEAKIRDILADLVALRAQRIAEMP